MFVELIFQFPSQLNETLQQTYGLALYRAALLSIILCSVLEEKNARGFRGWLCCQMQGCNVIKAGANPLLAAT